ncbi:MAG: hypothetical protein ACI4ES_05315 [Roseburia sp.]
MKKKLAGLLAAVMVLATGITAYAAPSASTATADTTGAEATVASLATGVSVSAGGVKIDGADSTVTPTIKVVSAETANSANTAAASIVGSNANVLKLVDVSLPVNFTSATITFDVAGVKAGQKVSVLHQKADGTWEEIKDVTVADGKVTATFTSLSPVAFVVEGTSDKTGAAVPVLPILAMLCLAGVVFCSAKVKFNK